MTLIQSSNRTGNDVFDVSYKHRVDISVIGMGYVGLVSMACLASAGHHITGVDSIRSKVDDIGKGICPINERGLDTLLKHNITKGCIETTSSIEEAVHASDVSLVCVGTPTNENGGCDTSCIKNVARSIGRALKTQKKYHLVVLRCSVPPGTTRSILVSEIERESGKSVEMDFGVCVNPEFLREGTAIDDFLNPPMTVVGSTDSRAKSWLKRVYWFLDGEIETTSLEAAEMLKYADNTWHALKVGFANEIGRFCKAYGIDSHEVMDLFVKDTKLNISPYYLKPGFAFGGSCLPKEIRAMQNLSRHSDLNLPIIEHLLESNSAQIDCVEDQIVSFSPKKVGFLGVTFKPGTDDLRESPTIELMSRIQNLGIEVAAFDPNLKAGTNVNHQFEYVRHAQPHLGEFMKSLPEVVVGSEMRLINDVDVLVVSHNTKTFQKIVSVVPPHVEVIDLVRMYPPDQAPANLHGASW